MLSLAACGGESSDRTDTPTPTPTPTATPEPTPPEPPAPEKVTEGELAAAVDPDVISGFDVR